MGVRSLSTRQGQLPSVGATVAVDGVRKRYRTGDGAAVALRNVSFTIDAASVCAVMGPSGSGKSTLLHLIGAMDSADRGRIRVGETEVTRLSRREQVAYRRRIGFVFQRFHLLAALTALDNVAAPLLPYRTDFDKTARARELLSAVGLSGKERSLPSRLSGGEQQRVAIARALINDPVLLLADEPTGNLDTKTGGEIISLLLALREQRNMTVIMATHDPVVASRCSQIILLRDGTVVDQMQPRASTTPGHVLERISRIEP
ncbi:MAG TPA: ABC transporter ATP-binding protein [Gaiellaceae bacterium]